MNSIKKVVDNLELSNKKEKIIKNRRMILDLKYKMSGLCFNINVAHYAYNLCEIKYLEKDNKIDKVFELLNENKKLETDYNVLLYKECFSMIELLEKEISYYHKMINVDLRERLLDIEYPKIYIYQGNIDNNYYFTDIIGKELYESDRIPNLAIFPVKDIDSNRKFRHFYNNISFRYLEGLTEDYSYEIESKNLGRIKLFKK